MDALTVLAECPLTAGLSPEAVTRLAAEARPLRLEAGETLFAAGDASEILYIVATGRLRATFPDGLVAGDIARLEPIGEIGLLSGEPRGASVHALRDSLLFAFSRAAFHAFAMAEPAAFMGMTRVIISRMREPDRAAKLRNVRKIRTLTVLGAHPAIDAAGFARQLQAALGARATLVDHARALSDAGADSGGVLHEWMSQLEFAHTQVVYVADGSRAWTRATLHQADRILVLADASDPTPPPALLDTLLSTGLHVSCELVLHRAGSEPAPFVSGWKQALGARSHFFVRPGHNGDIASLARQLTGFGIGLVLGGGGARGFAHVGLLQAMRELGIAVDVCGGASMGAYVAALHASGRDPEGIKATLRDTFIGRRLLNDYRWPAVALIAGGKFRRHLQGVFGDLRIEHMRTPFFCVSTNLTHARSEVHDEGRVADWLAASMCIPGLAPPVAWNGSLLCDGAVVNSLPADVMQNLGRGLVVASDVSMEGAIGAPDAKGPDADFEAVHHCNSEGYRVSLKDVLFRTTSLSSESSTQARAGQADLYLRMPVGSIRTFEWKRLDEIIEKGYRHALAELPALLEKRSGD
jgi:predicted acylesterase/phospholipase RssA/CRP-like cAMP-binding protein